MVTRRERVQAEAEKVTREGRPVESIPAPPLPAWDLNLRDTTWLLDLAAGAVREFVMKEQTEVARLREWGTVPDGQEPMPFDRVVEAHVDRITRLTAMLHTIADVRGYLSQAEAVQFGAEVQAFLRDRAREAANAPALP